MEAVRVRSYKIKFIQVHHKESATFMACAYAKYTGKLGMCLATSGPGSIHLLNGIYDAKLPNHNILKKAADLLNNIKEIYSFNYKRRIKPRRNCCNSIIRYCKEANLIELV